MTNILAAIDFSESNDKLLAQAERYATAFKARLYLLHAAAPEPDFVGFDVGPQSVRDAAAREYREEHVHLQRMANELRSKGVEAKAILVQGATADAIISESTQLNCALVIIGSHGHGLLHQLVKGSVSESVIRRLDCPVLLVPTHS